MLPQSDTSSASNMQRQKASKNKPKVDRSALTLADFPERQPRHISTSLRYTFRLRHESPASVAVQPNQNLASYKIWIAVAQVLFLLLRTMHGELLVASRSVRAFILKIISVHTRWRRPSPLRWIIARGRYLRFLHPGTNLLNWLTITHVAVNNCNGNYATHRRPYGVVWNFTVFRVAEVRGDKSRTGE